MRPVRPIHVALSCALALTGCVATTAPGVNGGTEQLRASQRSELRRAGVSDACIDQLSLAALTQVKGITDRSSRSSREILQKRQRIRTAAAKECPEL